MAYKRARSKLQNLHSAIIRAGALHFEPDEYRELRFKRDAQFRLPAGDGKGGAVDPADHVVPFACPYQGIESYSLNLRLSSF